MRRYSIAAVAAISVIAFTQIASAADLPRKAPAFAAPPPFSWTGFYVGLHAGWGWSGGTADVSPGPLFGALFDPVSLDQKGNGVVGGFQVGYNWQFASNWVVGIEGDFSGTGIHATTTAPLTIGGGVPLPAAVGNHIAERNFNWLATIRGRIGYAADRWLVYVTGGGAWGNADYTAGPNYTGLYSATQFSHTSSGWVAGGGFEYAFTNNWTARLEYLHYDLGDVTFNNSSFVVPGIGFAAPNTWKNDLDVVRVGVNYKL